MPPLLHVTPDPVRISIFPHQFDFCYGNLTFTLHISPKIVSTSVLGPIISSYFFHLSLLIKLWVLDLNSLSFTCNKTRSANINIYMAVITSIHHPIQNSKNSIHTIFITNSFIHNRSIKTEYIHKNSYEGKDPSLPSHDYNTYNEPILPLTLGWWFFPPTMNSLALAS